MNKISDLLASVSSLNSVPKDVSSEYIIKGEILLEYVNEKLMNNDNLDKLIGSSNKEVAIDNNNNHVKFMATVFSFNDFVLLAKTLPWVYRAYSSRHFSPEFFITVIDLWIDAVSTHMESPHKNTIIDVYRWIKSEDQNIREIANTPEKEIPDSADEIKDLEKRYLAFLIQGDDLSASELAVNAVSSSKDLSEFFLNVIQPAMMRIGLMWENNEITVAHEHLASSITARVVSQLYQKIPSPKVFKGKAIVTSAPNEFHNLGGRMIADLFEMNGWDVQYLGSNTPVRDLIEFAKSLKPVFIAVSVSMAFNLIRVQEMINKIRDEFGINSPAIIVGGRIFLEHPELANNLGADYCVTDLDKAEGIANSLIEE